LWLRPPSAWALVDASVNAVNNLIRNLGREDLELLLS
jgi:hypothetical protein